tara:strand:- start:291 stop:1145 length:855 start_codon:yes stop_codon:yes gene_type:complete
MKNIDTLIEDIHTLLETGINTSTVQNRDKIRNFAMEISSSVARQLGEGKREKMTSLRMSQIGKPDRQLWYELKSPVEPAPINGQTKLKFIMGDILEALLILLTDLSGHEVTEQQKEVEIDGVKGHKDCRIDGTVVDIKSASSYAFKKFKEGTIHTDDPFGYIAQISGYAEADKDEEAAFFAIDKSSGEMAVMKVEPIRMINAKQRIGKVKNFISSDIPPAKCYPDEEDGKSGNRKLAIGCVYCPFKEDCWKDANGGRGLRKFQYSNGIRYLTQVGKVPDVKEVA